MVCKNIVREHEVSSNCIRYGRRPHIYMFQPVDATRFKFGEYYIGGGVKSFRTPPDQPEEANGKFRDSWSDTAGIHGAGNPELVIVERGPPAEVAENALAAVKNDAIHGSVIPIVEMAPPARVCAG
jgi:hypothetical protein